MVLRTFRNWWLITLFVLSPFQAVANWEPTEIIGLSYPRIARLARITGIVVVHLSVGSDGAVDKAEAPAGHSVLAEAARRNASEWKFKRSTADHGESNDVYLVYRFALKGTCAASECRETFWVEYPNLVILYSEIPPIQVSEGRTN